MRRTGGDDEEIDADGEVDGEVDDEDVDARHAVARRVLERLGRVVHWAQARLPGGPRDAAQLAREQLVDDAQQPR